MKKIAMVLSLVFLVLTASSSCFAGVKADGYAEAKPVFNMQTKKWAGKHPSQTVLKDAKIGKAVKKLLKKDYNTFLECIDSVDIYDGVMVTYYDYFASGMMMGVADSMQGAIQIEAMTGAIVVAMLNNTDEIWVFGSNEITDSDFKAMNTWMAQFPDRKKVRK